MELLPFTIKSRCVADDTVLYAHITAALARQLPVVPQYYAHGNVAVMVGSGPSVLGQLDRIREEMTKPHRYLVALKGAHDWLLEEGIVPDYAIAIDPQEARADIFTMPQAPVHYLIASQVHPRMWDALEGMHVSLWHAYIRAGQSVPPYGTPLIAGGTTTGLRGITLLYSLGFREFDLFGYDSCVQDGVLRMNGDRPREGDDILHEIVVDGQTFLCNPSMTMQASEFQNLYQSMPDITLRAYGSGLIPAIVAARAKHPPRTISFLHGGGMTSASYRYRAWLPARELGASLNDFDADVLIFSKPIEDFVRRMKIALGQGKVVIADFCDDHFDQRFYRELVRLADVVTCSTPEMAKLIRPLGREPIVVPEPYELPESPPHCLGDRLLWFGHASNIPSLLRVLPECHGHPLTILTNRAQLFGWEEYQVREWSQPALTEELAHANIVVMPATALYKSPNRAIEAIRAGCFVVAEPHPSLEGIPGIWMGKTKEGIQWASTHQAEANAQILVSQTFLSERYAPRTVACAWSRILQACPFTWAQEAAAGLNGSMSIGSAATARAISAPSPSLTGAPSG